MVFPSKKQFANELYLLELVEKTKQLYVLPTLIEYHYVIASFDM
jgi:hypothetical protein